MEQSTVLVVEDDPAIRGFVREALTDAGYAVRIACDGQEGVDDLRRQRPSALLLDIGLPFVDGTEVARLSRSLYGGDVPIIVMSANHEAGADARELGASGFLAKPFLLDELESVVGRALAGRESLTFTQREIADRRALERDASRRRGGDLRHSRERR